jgi:nucleoside-diphosphate-sugar epimerase
MTCYIVLGASGFLGSHVHEAINRSEEAPALVAVSRYPPLLAMPPNSSWVPLDLVTATVAELVVLIEASRPDAVINCAGRTSGTSQQLWDLNTTFVDKLIQALRQSGPAPLVHLGSAAEYGVQPSGIPIKETADARPVSSYGRSKLAATRKIASAAEKGDISATVLRVFNPIEARSPKQGLGDHHGASRCLSGLHCGQGRCERGPAGNSASRPRSRDQRRAWRFDVVSYLGADDR